MGRRRRLLCLFGNEILLDFFFTTTLDPFWGFKATENIIEI